MTRIAYKYFCVKCNRDIEGFVLSDRPEDKYTEDEKKRAKEMLLNLHDRNEHTQCMRCGKKIIPGVDPKEEWSVRIVGKKQSEPKLPGDTGFSLLTGIFCKKCVIEIDKDKS